MGSHRRAAAGRLPEVSAPDFVVGWHIHGSEAFAPDNVVRCVDGAAVIVVARKGVRNDFVRSRDVWIAGLRYIAGDVVESELVNARYSVIDVESATTANARAPAIRTATPDAAL